MNLSYSEVVTILAGMNGVVPESDGALRARLRHFQRLGFPEGSNTGKGRRAEYDLSMTLQLVLALEFMQAGVTPLQTVAMINANWEKTLVQIFIAATPEGLLTDDKKKPLHPDIALCTSPEALRDLTADAESRKDRGDFYFVPFDRLAEFFRDEEFLPETGTYYRWIVILLAHLVRNAMVWIQAVVGKPPINVLSELSQLLADRGHDVDFPEEPHGDD